MQVDALIKKSIEYAFANYPLLADYVKEHAQEMEPVVMKQHIDLYVNNFSLALGKEGKDAIAKLLSVSDNSNQLAGEDMFVKSAN